MSNTAVNVAGRNDFPYSPVPDSVRRLMEKIPSVGVPAKMDKDWLAALGFGGGNNGMSIPLFKQVGILDASGQPTAMYRALRAKDRAAFGAGVKRAYAALFDMYPDAHRQDNEALMAFARSRTDYAEGTQKLAVRTFKVFTSFGEFDGASSSADDPEELADSAHRDKAPERAGAKREQLEHRSEHRSDTGTVGLTVNIQLQLPPSADGEIYDKLFSAMAKHLKGLVSAG